MALPAKSTGIWVGKDTRILAMILDQETASPTAVYVNVRDLVYDERNPTVRFMAPGSDGEANPITVYHEQVKPSEMYHCYIRSQSGLATTRGASEVHSSTQLLTVRDGPRSVARLVADIDRCRGTSTVLIGSDRLTGYLATVMTYSPSQNVFIQQDVMLVPSLHTVAVGFAVGIDHHHFPMAALGDGLIVYRQR